MVLVRALYGHEKWEICFVFDQFFAACSPKECGRVSTAASTETTRRIKDGKKGGRGMEVSGGRGRLYIPIATLSPPE